MKRFAKLLPIALIFVVFAGLAGCGGSSKKATPVPATLSTITVGAGASTVNLGQTLNMTAIATYSDKTTSNVTTSATWQTSDPTIAIIDSKGLLSAAGPNTGTITVTATVGNTSGFMDIKVQTSGSSPGAATLTQIVVTPVNPLDSPTSVAKGQTQQFAASGIYSDGSQADLTRGVVWSTGDSSIATITQTGNATGIGIGSTTVIATLGSISGSAPLSVSSASLSSISIACDPVNLTIEINGQATFSVTGIYSDGTAQDLTAVATYSSADSTIAAFKSPAPNANVAAGVAAGTVNISAKVGTLSDTETLTVLPATLTALSITPETASIAKGTTQQFSLTGIYSDGSSGPLTGGVSWSSSAPSIALIDQTTGLAQGIAASATPVTIQAQYGGLSATAELTVRAATLSSILVTPAMPTVGMGGSVQFTASGVFSDNTTQDLSSVVQWSSSAPSVASINSVGVASVSTSATPGQTTVITAQYLGVSGLTTLTAARVTLTGINVLPASPVVPTRSRVQFTAMGVYSDGSTAPLSGVRWTTSSPSRAMINRQGLARTKWRTGAVVVCARFRGITGSTTMTITSSTLTSVTISPVNPTIAVGTTQQFALTGTYGDGTTIDVTPGAYWTTSNWRDVVVGRYGLVFGRAVGQATITANYKSLSDQTLMTVSAATLTGITVNPPTPTVVLGGVQQFTATGSFSDGSTQDITSLVQWSSSAPTTAVVNKLGVASSTSIGSATISATFKGQTGTAVLNVN